MTTAGWIFVSISWTAITGLCIFCFSRIFAKRRRS